METISIQTKTPSKAARWTGRIFSGITTLFLLMDSIMKIFREQHHVDGTRDIGFQDSFVIPLGIVLLLCTVLYIIPRTAIFGALLLTAYFGGAVAIMILKQQAFIFPVIFCTLVWGGLYLRDEKLRSIVPFRKHD
jgi:hypothetical protein